jgi:hypothetical protein
MRGGDRWDGWRPRALRPARKPPCRR